MDLLAALSSGFVPICDVTNVFNSVLVVGDGALVPVADDNDENDDEPDPAAFGAGTTDSLGDISYSSDGWCSTDESR